MLEERSARSNAVLQPTQLQARACIAAHRNLTTLSPHQTDRLDRRRRHPQERAMSSCEPACTTRASNPGGHAGDRRTATCQDIPDLKRGSR